MKDRDWRAARNIGTMVEIAGAPCAITSWCLQLDERKSAAVVTLPEHVPVVQQALGPKVTVVGAGTRRALDALALLPAGLALYLDHVRKAASPQLLRLASIVPHSGGYPVIDAPEGIRGWHKDRKMELAAGNMLRIRRDRRRVLRALWAVQDLHTGEEDIADVLKEFFQASRVWLDEWETNVQRTQLAFETFTRFLAANRQLGGSAVILVREWLMYQALSIEQECLGWQGICRQLYWPGAGWGAGAETGWAYTRAAGQAAMQVLRALLQHAELAFGADIRAARRAGVLPMHLLQMTTPAWQVLRNDDPARYAALARGETSGRLGLEFARVLRNIAGEVPGYLPVATGEKGEVVMVKSGRWVQLPDAEWQAGYLTALVAG